MGDKSGHRMRLAFPDDAPPLARQEWDANGSESCRESPGEKDLSIVDETSTEMPKGTSDNTADLAARTRAALASAERALRSARREWQDREHQVRVAAVAVELATLNEDALIQSREEMEAAITHYVASAVTFNRILAESREELRAIGGVDEDDIGYRTPDGRAGVRANGVVRVQEVPWQTVSRIAMTVLQTFAPVPHMSLDNPQDRDLDDLVMAIRETATKMAKSADVPETDHHHDMPDWPQVADHRVNHHSNSQPEPIADPAVPDVSGEEWLAPLLDQFAQQTEEIAQLREQLNQQGDVIARVVDFFDAIRMPRPDA
jgi:hypothetical protein